MTSQVLRVRRGIHLPGFGTRHWKGQDHTVPLSIHLKNAKANIFIDKPVWGGDRDINVFPKGHLVLEYSPPPAKILAGLKSGGSAGAEAAELIYEKYLEAVDNLESLLMSRGNVKGMMRAIRLSRRDFFSNEIIGPGEQVSWQVDDGESNSFVPKLPKPRGRNPLFTAPQLITPAKWQRIQEAADDGAIPRDEMLELYNIRSKVNWREIRVATIEASIVSESLLRRYGLQTLEKSGFSKTKIKRLREELTFNNLLNIVLPLSLSKSDLKKVATAIQAVDELRRARNDLVHGNISEKDVDNSVVEKGVEGAIKLAEFLKRYLEGNQ